MPAFVNQPGEPLIMVKTSCAAPPAPATTAKKGKRSRRSIQPHPKTEITLTQQRFFYDGHADKSRQSWLIPVCIKTAGGKPFCQLLSEHQQVVPVVGCSPWVFANAGAVGYYRTHYDADDLNKLNAVATAGLGTAERAALVGDEAALVTAGMEKVGAFLDLVGAMSAGQERSVVEGFNAYLAAIDERLSTPDNRDAYRLWVRSTFHPVMNKLGWTRAPGEAEDTHTVRAEIIRLLGTVGQDPDIIREATKLAQQYLDNPDSVDASLAGAVLDVAARSGDPALFDEYIAALGRLRSPEQFYHVSNALAEFRDPKLVERTLQLAVSPETRSQDAPRLIASVLSTPANQEVAWPWVKTHWPEVENKITTSSGGAIIAATRRFCDASTRDDMLQFFTEHRIPAAERALRQAVEGVNACIAFRDRQKGNLAAWLNQHSASGASGNR
jgi:aminopeptidase N/puromycin-sensitive aminopeptidase